MRSSFRSASCSNDSKKRANLLLNKWVRFLGPLAIICAAVFLLRNKLPFFADAYQQMLQADPVGLLAAFALILLSLWAMAEVMRLLLSVGGDRLRVTQTLALTFIANSWSSSFPGGAAISTMYQFRTIRRWGVSSVISSWFIIVSGALSTTWLIGLGILAIVFFGATFSIGPLIGSSLFMASLAALVWWIAKHPQPTSRFLIKAIQAIGNALNREVHPMITIVDGSFKQLSAVSLSLRKFLWIALLSLMNWLFEIFAVWICVWSVTGVLPGTEPVLNNTTFMGVVLAFVTAKIVGTAQVTPAGIGPVETAMTASLVAVGMTASGAFSVVIVYRILSFALITAIGWLVYFFSVAHGGMKAQDFITGDSKLQ